MLPGGVGPLGMVAGLMSSSTSSTESAEHQHTAQSTPPLGWDPHFSAPGGEKLPQCSPGTGLRLPQHPALTLAAGAAQICSGADLLSAVSSPNRSFQAPLCARWEQQRSQHGLEMETASRGAHQH